MVIRLHCLNAGCAAMTLPAMELPQIDSSPPARAAADCRQPAALCKSLHNPRSILFLVDQLTQLGGGERALFDLARGLADLGFRVSVVTFRGNADPAAFALCDNITILPFASCFSREAVRVALQLRRLIRREHVDIVQTFFESADIYGAIVARLSGVPIVISSRRDMGILRSARHRVAYRLLGRGYSAVLAVSDQVRRWHTQADHLRSDRVHTIHNGISVDRFDAAMDRSATRRAMGLPVNVPLVATVANIEAWKGVDVFLRAAAMVRQSHPDAAFAIAGAWSDAELVAALRQQARSLGIADCTWFLGRVADVPSLLLASDVFTLLSRSEGFPNAVLEAMAARLPVVATAVGGTVEAIEDGVTGFFVPYADAAAAAAHIVALLSDDSLRRTVGAAGRHRVERSFSLLQMVRKHADLYDALLKDRS